MGSMGLHLRYPGTKLGILGGGQLARMLALACHPRGVEPWVLSDSESDPAAQVTHFWVKGNVMDPATLKKFLTHIDFCTFESEWIHSEIFSQLNKKLISKIFPKVPHIAAIQDRWKQKKLLETFGLKTLPFLRLNSLKNIKNVQSQFKLPFVIKQRRLGYDGYGTLMIRSTSDLDNLRTSNTEAVFDYQYGYIAEKFIEFQRELAVILVRSQRGQVRILPWVETHQSHARCHAVHGPIELQPSHTRLQGQLKAFLEQIKYVGVLAVEIFELKNGQLLINELAPRVHNSGHYSLDALKTSQFEYHMRAILGLPLPDVEFVRPGFAMWNILGNADAMSNFSDDEKIFFHWYGKSEMREGRKMGHLNVLGRNRQQAYRYLLKRMGQNES